MALACLCFLPWQGHYSSCQCSPTSPPPCLLVMESGGTSRDVATQWPSGKCSPLWMTDEWREQHWKHVIECHKGVTSSNTNTLFPLFSPHLPLSCLSPSLCVWLPTSPPTSPPLSPVSFTNQGSEKGWSDYRRTAEEDREQPQSPRFPHQEWPSTCLKKKMNPTHKNTRDLSVVVVANHSLTWWLHI